MEIRDIYDNYPEFFKQWTRESGKNTLCDEFMRQQGFKSARFVITSKTRSEEIGYWYMDKNDYSIFNLLWAEKDYFDRT